MKIAYPFFRAFESAVNAMLFLAGLPGSGKRQKTGTHRKVLLARYDLIGDFVLFTATLPLYRALFKDATIVLLVRDSVFEIARSNPHVDEVWVVRNKVFRLNPIERFRWFRKMRKHRFDLAINTVYSTSWVHLDCLVGWTYAPRRIAHECLDPRPRVGKQLYFTELVPAQGEWKFTIDRDHDIPAYLGFNGMPHKRTVVNITEDDREKAAIIRPQGEYAIVVPSARNALRRWGGHQFVDAILRTESLAHIQWVLCGTMSEKKLCGWMVGELRSRSVMAVDLSGRTTLGELCALIERADFFLGNETGILHIAVALGVPAICPTSGGMYGLCFPYPDNPLAISVTNPLPCYRCREHCILDEPECITKILPDNVAKAIAQVIEGKADGGRTGPHA